MGSTGGFPSSCDNAWKKVKTTFDSNINVVCNFKVTVGKYLGQDNGIVEVTSVEVRPESIVYNAEIRDLSTNAKVFGDTITHRYASIPSILGGAKIIHMPATSGDVGGE